MDRIQYRLATSTDIQLLVDLRMAFSDEYAGKPDAEADRNLRNALEKYFASEINKTYFTWYATVNNQPASSVGMVLRVQPPNIKNPSGIWGYIMSVYTYPQYRRQGLSKNLLDRTLETGKQHGITAFELHATQDGQQVYPKAGFELFHEPTFRKYI